MKVVLKKNKKIGKIWHPQTRLIFKSATERIVVGYLNYDESISNLSEENVKVCKEWGFRFGSEKDESEKDESEKESEKDESEKESESDTELENVNNVVDEQNNNHEEQRESKECVDFDITSVLNDVSNYIKGVENNYNELLDKYNKLSTKFNQLRVLLN
jgi:hypothetical protein